MTILSQLTTNLALVPHLEKVIKTMEEVAVVLPANLITISLASSVDGT